MRRLLALPAVLAVSLAWAAPAFGHAAYVGSEPAPGQRLDASPQRIVLVFTEPLNGRLAGATLRPAGGGAPIPAALRVAERAGVVAGCDAGAHSLRLIQ